MKTARHTLLLFALTLAACGDASSNGQSNAADSADQAPPSIREAGLRGDAERFAAQAFAEMAAGNYAQASITARRAVIADPTHPSAHHALAWAAMNEGPQNVQIIAAMEAVRLAPDSAHFRRTLGLVFQNSRRLRDAANAFREAVRLNPADTLSWRDLGRVAYEAGNYALADSAFERLAELDPAHFDTAASDARQRDDARRRAP